MGQCLLGGLLPHLEGSHLPLAPSARLQPHSVLLPSDPAGAHHHVPARHRSQGHRAAGGRPPGAACTQGREAGGPFEFSGFSGCHLGERNLVIHEP